MKKNALAGIAASILLAGIGGCYYVPTGYNGTARATVGAKDVPVYIASIALVVTGPDMMPIQLVFPADTPQIDLDVPAGPARTFTLFLTTPSATLTAEQTVNLAGGEVREILFTPKLGGTEILIPDGYNYRIVQISDMTGAGWIAKSYTDFGLGAPYEYAFHPWDIDFDDQGRIYIANDGSDYSYAGVIRIDDINHVSLSDITSVDPSLGRNCLAVDRANGYIYYTPGYGVIYRKNINSPTIETDIPESFIPNNEPEMPNFGTTGIAVDDQGFLYITNNMSSDVLKYDPRLPEGSRVVASNSVEVPWDVMVKDGRVLVSDPGTDSIAIFDTDLTSLGNYDGPALDPFVGPRRFLGALGMPGIYITDENNTTKERVVFMEDISGAGWTTYGTHGSGPGQFEFYTVP